MNIGLRMLSVVFAAAAMVPANWIEAHDADAVTVPAASTSAQQMTQAANRFIAILSPEQRDQGVFPLRDATRAIWSNLPVFFVRPTGLFLGDMTPEQRRAAHALLRASMSSQGYQKVAGVIRLDNLLNAQRSEDMASQEPPAGLSDDFFRAVMDSWGSAYYAVAVFGEPSSGDDWGWRVAGHHAAATFTVSGGRVAFTPVFLGTEPLEVERGPYAGWMVLSHEGARGVELVQALSQEQKKEAVIGAERPADVIAGPGRRDSLSRFEGLQATKMTAAQRRLLRLLVDEYVHNADFDSAHGQLELIEDAGWDNVWFSWRGPVHEDGLYYYRVHGPRILIEYIKQTANHVHSIVRDPENDYGEDWLEYHYQESHPDDAIEAARKRFSED